MKVVKVNNELRSYQTEEERELLEAEELLIRVTSVVRKTQERLLKTWEYL